ncbi:hypothetical protein SAMN05443575_1450 [Jatrophihabitans endophyticus]|uniref:Uncharacterized protein n=1 Tax=Jatrophihabitans endophyticus TaxID=1206085 RepID=A0A1M5HAL9_9ACTN|nr:DUF5313 family protein [Jatrophihabitans endophyticus]SHG12918.1 hypothetical protein SAMN05443575_1450 [Jatrophihabitans endophyticus]
MADDAAAAGDPAGPGGPAAAADAARAEDVAAAHKRPPLAKLLRYEFGGTLPAEYRTWVLHDLTCSTWWLRHFGRTALLVVPLFTIYLVAMPGSLSLRLLSGFTFVGAVLLYSFVNILVATDRKAIRAGYPTGRVSDVREQRSVDRHRASSYERRERIAQRRESRRR